MKKEKENNKDPYLSELETFDEFEEESISPVNRPIATQASKLASDIPVSLDAVIARKAISVKDLMGLTTGQVVELEKGLHEAVDLVVGGKVIARGELVDIDGKLGVRITETL